MTSEIQEQILKSLNSLKNSSQGVENGWMPLLEYKSPAVWDREGEPHTEMQFEICCLLGCMSSVLSAWGNQAVQSILMNTNQELWQEGGEENVQYRTMQLKNHICTFYSCICKIYITVSTVMQIITEGKKCLFNVKGERPLHLLTLCHVFTFLLSLSANKILLI